MLVCWEWLKQYVDLAVLPDDMATKFAMSGLNHESTEMVGTDTVLDLEVTSNRGDCLGHIGVAREAAVLLSTPLNVPSVAPSTSDQAVAGVLSVENRFLEACPKYTARVIQGVKVGPSPEWLSRRLNAIGIASVNNIVDVTNYVMMECGQPLHAFDLSEIKGGKIVVRPARKGEQLVAIDHKEYELDPEMIVIADADRAIALGGVMGGADTEVSEATVDLLVEAASFSPTSIRRAARKLKLHSPASFRFERTPDPHGLDWASQRCCELILQVAGGELLGGVVEDGTEPKKPGRVTLRRSQIERVLGIEVSADETDQILGTLGCQLQEQTQESVTVVPPSWRADLTREVDLIEEVARIHGYEQIPENVAVPLRVAPTRPKDIALGRVRSVLSACGIDEAMTPSVVGTQLEANGSLWGNEAPLATEAPLLVGAKLLRRSIVPSLLVARHTNQAQSVRNAQLYEIGTIYLADSDPQKLPSEKSILGIVGAGELRTLRGVVEEIVSQTVSQSTVVTWTAHEHPSFESGSLQQMSIGGKTLGTVGLIAKKVQDDYSLDQTVAAAELDFDLLTGNLEEVRQANPVSLFPSITRDLNFVVDEALTWDALSQLCRQEGGELLQRVTYQETYRDAKKDGVGKKRLLLSLDFQSLQRTLTGNEVDEAIARIVEACKAKFAASLLV